MERHTKTCTICKKELPLHEFVTERRAKDGRSGRCRPCHREVSRSVRRGEYKPTGRWEVSWPRPCARCGEEKVAEEFPLDPGRKSGRHPYCKPCRREDARERAQRRRESGLQAMDNLRAAARRVGADVDKILQLNDELGGQCEICDGLPNGNHGRLVLDHNHKTNQFRGLLCSQCNTGLGLLGDDPERLRKAVNYLKERGHYGTRDHD